MNTINQAYIYVHTKLELYILDTVTHLTLTKYMVLKGVQVETAAIYCRSSH